MSDSIEIKKKLGRPLGKYKGPSFRYKPIKWLPEFNQVVFDYYCIPGCTYEELAEKYKYHKVHIGNIMNSPQAELIKAGLDSGIIERNQRNIPALLAASAEKAASRIADFISDDSLYQANPFKFIDRALKIGAAVGVIKGSEEGGKGSTINNTQINLGDSAISELAKSLELSNDLRLKVG